MNTRQNILQNRTAVTKFEPMLPKESLLRILFNNIQSHDRIN